MAYEFRVNRGEINRLNNAISAEEKNINALFQTIGQTYFANHRQNPEPNQAESVRGIMAALERAKSYKDQINTLRGIAICPNCKAEVSIESAFCNVCGTKMPVAVQPPVQPMIDPNTVICQSCGNRCQKTQRFCNVCGANLAAQVQSQPVPQPAPAPQPVPARQALPEQEPVAPVQEAPAPAAEPEKPAKKVCPNCGTEMEADCSFCLECGTKL